jgi:hypothetical protein
MTVKGNAGATELRNAPHATTSTVTFFRIGTSSHRETSSSAPFVATEDARSLRQRFLKIHEIAGKRARERGYPAAVPPVGVTCGRARR